MPSKPRITSFCLYCDSGGASLHAATNAAATASNTADTNRMLIRGGPLYPCLMRVLGVDYGQKRIGLALSDPTATLARPWKALTRSGNASQVARALADIVDSLAQQDEAVDAIVLGFPRRLSGEA